jgi:hypothetical protein
MAALSRANLVIRVVSVKNLEDLRLNVLALEAGEVVPEQAAHGEGRLVTEPGGLGAGDAVEARAEVGAALGDALATDEEEGLAAAPAGTGSRPWAT